MDGRGVRENTKTANTNETTHQLLLIELDWKGAFFWAMGDGNNGAYFCNLFHVLFFLLVFPFPPGPVAGPGGGGGGGGGGRNIFGSSPL